MASHQHQGSQRSHPPSADPGWRLYSERSQVLALRHGGETLKKGEESSRRSNLLKALRAGELVELEMDAQVFFQADGIQNRNFVRFRNGILRKLAKSFAGAPFLRDHRQGDMLAVGGTILKSGLEKIEAASTFQQTISLSAPWAVEMALTGLLSKFSIGWNPTGAINCTACKAGFRDCGHWPGDELEDGTIVEAEFQEAEGIETSAVPIPAVPQVGISEVRAALALSIPTRKPSRSDSMDLETLAKALGVSEGSDIPDLVNSLKADAAKLRTKLNAETESHNQTKAALAEASKLADDAKEREAKADADRLVDRCYEDGKLKPHIEDGKRIASKMETALRSYCQQFGIDAATEYAEDMPTLTHAGKGSVAARTAPAVAASQSDAGVVMTSEMESAAKQLGITKEQILKHNPQLRGVN